MADEDGTPTGNDGAGNGGVTNGAEPQARQSAEPQARQSNVPPLTLNLQYVKDLSFENPGAPQSMGNMAPGPEISVDVNVETNPLADRTYEVVLHLSASAKREGAIFFLVEVAYGGVCIVGPQVPEEHVIPIIAIEGPRLLFPFARSIVANCVRDGGFPPLLINPIDFASVFRQMAERQGETATA